MSELWRDAALEIHFAELTKLLKSGEQFWRHHAFKHLQPPWQQQYPQLIKQLRELSYAQAEVLSEDEHLLWQFLRNKLPVVAAIQAACDLGEYSERPIFGAEPHTVPAQKWRQIGEFSKCIPANELPLLEWCSGKAHLSRITAHQRGCSAAAIERDAHLVAVGKKLNARAGIDIEFHCLDVMTSNAAALLQAQQNVIALHACGDLHLQLLSLSTARGVQTVTLAPCCYQLTTDDSRFVVSQLATASGLRLRRDDLRTAVHGSVTASERQREQRRQLQAWRLGFDLLQRDVRGVYEYLATPSLPTAVLHNGFKEFCRRVAAHREIALPSGIDYARYEQIGAERLAHVAAFDLPRIAFRRALELWLALDRALFLRERQYSVEMGIFCERAITPRNILIRAAFE